MNGISLKTVRALSLALLLAILGVGAVCAATLTATVDRSPIISGETFEYVLTLTGGDGKQPPDLSPLTRDFDVVGQGRRSQMATIDGKRTQVNEWVLALSPKRSGKLTIPPLTVAGLSGPPVPVEVIPAASGTTQVEDRPLFVRLDAGDVSPYVQSDIPVSMRIYDGVGLRPGSSWAPPTAQGATFTEVGDQRSYSRTIGKQRYVVTEQAYLMRPQRSGAIEIEPVTLNAKVASGTMGSASDMAHLLGRGNARTPWLPGSPDFARDLTIRSNPLTIMVKERPADAKGWFLPARGVTVAEHWSPPVTQARIGETLTRTIRVEARGATPNQLPPIPVTDVAGARLYEETSRSESAMVKGEPGATLTKTISVVPTRAGEITLPAIEIGWWNTSTQKQETTVLPGQTFTVPPDARAQAAVPAPAAPAASAPAAASDPPAPSEGNGDDRLTSLALSLLAWLQQQRMAAGVVTALVVALAWMLLLFRRRATAHRVAATVATPAPGMARAGAASLPRATRGRSIMPTGPVAAEQALMAACKANDAAAAHRAFLAWTRPDGQGGASQALRTAGMEAAAADLRQRLYASVPDRWNGAAFLAAFKAEQRARLKKPKATRGARLAPLYPAG